MTLRPLHNSLQGIMKSGLLQIDVLVATLEMEEAGQLLSRTVLPAVGLEQYGGGHPIPCPELILYRTQTSSTAEPARGPVFVLQQRAPCITGRYAIPKRDKRGSFKTQSRRNSRKHTTQKEKAISPSAVLNVCVCMHEYKRA